MRLISTIVSLCVLGYGAWWASEKNPKLKSYFPLVKNKVMEVINSGSFPSFEARFTIEQIMEMNKKALLRDAKHKFLETHLKLYPYLLMEVKYSQSPERTGEGVILWDLLDGEMVINTKDWEKSHGYGDCIKASAERHEYKIINLISQKNGIADRDTLSRALLSESEFLDNWLESCRKKKLIVQTGNHYRLHVQNPKMNVMPETIIEGALVTKSCKNAERLTRRFGNSQIKRTAEYIFGNDFAIRNVIEIYLPVYSITVQKPDGSMHTTYWNSVNGREIKGIFGF